MKKRLSLLAALLLVAACQGPVTLAPQGTQAEIMQEAAIQRQLAKEQAARGTVDLGDVAFPILSANAPFCGDRVRTASYKGQQARLCSFPVVIDKKDKNINAYTDGEKIIVSQKMLDFIQNRNELALVVGHELAHAALNHVGKTMQNTALGQIGGFAVDQLLASQGLNTGGQFASLGAGVAQQRYSVGFEQEADYVGMYFMARAGFDTAGVANFWRRMAANDSRSINNRSSHPTSPERFIAIERTHREIAAKVAAGQPLTPNMAPKK